ncbi:hypothetical protein EWB00_009615 [Schistosoma japonicum]|uniref:Uncharacterized protein n=1 Tax=Schistosoma japonicum TaxID=6182 RepID=A0A4Z2CLN5_SCHJA|nr:hypothetical protein EWB00_009615 [Schistosoma japonicum]
MDSNIIHFFLSVTIITMMMIMNVSESHVVDPSKPSASGRSSCSEEVRPVERPGFLEIIMRTFSFLFNNYWYPKST